MKKRHHIISITIIFVIGFLFVHSELDFFTPEQHAHDTHDFCDIVDNAKPENTSIEKLKINTLDVQVIFLSTPVNQYSDSQTINYYTSHKPIIEINLNILYSSFLI